MPLCTTDFINASGSLELAPRLISARPSIYFNRARCEMEGVQISSISRQYYMVSLRDMSALFDFLEPI